MLVSTLVKPVPVALAAGPKLKVAVQVTPSFTSVASTAAHELPDAQGSFVQVAATFIVLPLGMIVFTSVTVDVVA